MRQTGEYVRDTYSPLFALLRTNYSQMSRLQERVHDVTNVKFIQHIHGTDRVFSYEVTVATNLR